MRMIVRAAPVAAIALDGVCEKNHGCAPLPIGDDVFRALQERDPRPLE